MKLDDLQTRQNIKLYPPRFVVTVKETSDARDSKAVFTFEGTINPIVKEIILARGIFHNVVCILACSITSHVSSTSGIEASTSPVYPGQEKAVLGMFVG